MVTKIRSKLSSIPPEMIIIILIFFINLVIVTPKLLPSYQLLNPHDETKYVESGRKLVDGLDIRELGRSPLSSIIYAGIYLFVSHSHDWFMLSVGIGRIILFSLLWFSTFYLGSRLKEYAHPYIVAGVIFFSPAMLIILGNPSDALFAAMSALALAKTLAFNHSKEPQDLAFASLFVGLAFASRPDGLFLTPLFLIIVIAIGFRKVKFGRLLASAIVPGLIVVGVFVMLRAITTGDFRTGIGDKAYNSISWVASPEAKDLADQSRINIEQFGSRGENRGSVITAFLRNPPAMFDRFFVNAKNAPNVILLAYGGKKIAPFLFLAALGGVYALLKKRAFSELIILLLWPLPAVLYLAFYLRSGFFLLSFYVPIILAAIGIAYFLSKQPSKTERTAVVLILSMLSLYSLIDGKPAFLAVGLIALATVILTWVAQRLYPDRVETEIAGLFLALCAAAILHPPFTFPQAWSIGTSSQERAINFMQDELKRGSGVGTYVPLPALAARMNDVGLQTIPLGEDADIQFQGWLENNNVKALYIEPVFIMAYPERWELIQRHIGSILEREFLADPGSVQVFIVQE
jgi:hypothetical protein